MPDMSFEEFVEACKEWGYICPVQLRDGRLCAIHELASHVSRLLVDISRSGYVHAY